MNIEQLKLATASDVFSDEEIESCFFDFCESYFNNVGQDIVEIMRVMRTNRPELLDDLAKKYSEQFGVRVEITETSTMSNAPVVIRISAFNTPLADVIAFVEYGPGADMELHPFVKLKKFEYHDFPAIGSEVYIPTMDDAVVGGLAKITDIVAGQLNFEGLSCNFCWKDGLDQEQEGLAKQFGESRAYMTGADYSCPLVSAKQECPKIGDTVYVETVNEYFIGGLAKVIGVDGDYVAIEEHDGMKHRWVGHLDKKQDELKTQFGENYAYHAGVI